jgi:two-component system, chemotaxis family, chemotaxis protein CheY
MRPIAERTFYSWKMGLIEVGEHQSLDREKIRKLITLCRTPGSNMGKNEAISAVLKSFRQQLSSAEATLGRVLVVEDHSRLRSLLKTILRQKSSEVVTVDSAESAWKILNSRKFDLVVTDWKLPGKTGVDLVVQMRENPALSTVPVVLISGWADAVDIVSVEQMGVDAFLPKPFTEAQLYARAIAAIEQRKKSEHDSKKGLKL